MVRTITYRDVLNMIGIAISNKYVRSLARLVMLEYMIHDGDPSYFRYVRKDVSNTDLINRVHPLMGSYITERLLAYMISKVAMPEEKWDITLDHKDIHVESDRHIVTHAKNQYPGRYRTSICDVRTLIGVDDSDSTDKNAYVPLHRENQLRGMVSGSDSAILNKMLKPNSNILALWRTMKVKDRAVLLGVLNHKRYSLWNTVIEANKPPSCLMSMSRGIPVPRDTRMFTSDIDIVSQ